MRSYLHIDLKDRTVRAVEQKGEELVRVGRYLIARTLLEENIAGIDPLSPANPLIFSAGPFAGTNFSNANRTSVGCKSPLTGGVKEANAGGTLGVALGQLHLSGFTLHGAADEWVIIHLRKDGSVGFDSAAGFMGMGNFETAALLHEKYGKKVSLALCGPVGEYQGLLAGIAVSDTDRRPARLAAMPVLLRTSWSRSAQEPSRAGSGRRARLRSVIITRSNGCRLSSARLSAPMTRG